MVLNPLPLCYPYAEKREAACQQGRRSCLPGTPGQKREHGFHRILQRKMQEMPGFWQDRA
jgi:hypothetical protein